MTALLALYIPRAEQLTERLTMLLIAWIVLVACARFLLGIRSVLPAILMLVGFLLAVAPGIYDAYLLQGPDGFALAYDKPHTFGFFRTVAFFHVGLGSLLGIGGMTLGLVVAIAIDIVRKRKKKAKATADAILDNNASRSA